MSKALRKLTLLREKMNGSKSSEPREFNEKYEHLLKARQEIKEVMAAMKKWESHMHSMVNTGRVIGKLINTDEFSRMQHESALVGIPPPKYMESIAEKIKLLDSTVKSRKQIEELRLSRQIIERKLAEAERKNSPEVEKLSAKLETAKRDYHDTFNEVNVAVDYTSKAYQSGGICKLLTWELNAFTFAQEHYFANLKGMITSPMRAGGTNTPEDATEDTPMKDRKGSKHRRSRRKSSKSDDKNESSDEELVAEEL